MRVLSEKPIHVVEVSEAYTSTIDPFTGKPILNYTPSMIRIAVRGGSRKVRVIKVRLRLARVGNGLILDRDVVGAINIGLRYLTSGGSPMALGSTGPPHEVRVKLMNPHRGPTPPLTVLKLTKSN